MPTIRQARSSDWPGVVAVFAMVIGFTYSDDLVELGFVVAGRGGTDTRWAVFLVDILLVLATAGLAWRMAGLDARRFVVRLLRSWWPVGAVAVVVLHILTAAISASTGLHLLGAVLFALAMGVVLVSALEAGAPRGVVVGNRDGDVNFVEFFDYNCGYCKHAMADMLTLMKSDSKLRVVLKEFPVLGPSSVEAAQVAVAVRMQDPSGKKYLDFHQKLLNGRGQADKARAMAAAKDAGLDMAKLEKDLASPEINATLNENFKLAEEMGLNGTPSYVIGKDVVVGAVGAPGLAKKISEARCGKATC